MEFVYNDGGRKAAGMKGDARDCVVRAIAIGTGENYMQVYSNLFHLNMKQHRKPGKATPRNGNTSMATIKSYLAKRGWKWTPTMGIGTGCKVHLHDGELPMGRLIVRVSKHLCAVIDGVIHDTHNPQRDVHHTHPITDRQPMLAHEFTRDGKFAHSIQRRCVYGYWQYQGGA